MFLLVFQIGCKPVIEDVCLLCCWHTPPTPNSPPWTHLLWPNSLHLAQIDLVTWGFVVSCGFGAYKFSQKNVTLFWISNKACIGSNYWKKTTCKDIFKIYFIKQLKSDLIMNNLFVCAQSRDLSEDVACIAKIVVDCYRNVLHKNVSSLLKKCRTNTCQLWVVSPGMDIFIHIMLSLKQNQLNFLK